MTKADAFPWRVGLWKEGSGGGSVFGSVVQPNKRKRENSAGERFPKTSKDTRFPIAANPY